MHPYISQAVAAERIRDLQNEAAAARLARLARPGAAPPGDGRRQRRRPVPAAACRSRPPIPAHAARSSWPGPQARWCASLRPPSALTGSRSADERASADATARTVRPSSRGPRRAKALAQHTGLRSAVVHVVLAAVLGPVLLADRFGLFPGGVTDLAADVQRGHPRGDPGDPPRAALGPRSGAGRLRRSRPHAGRQPRRYPTAPRPSGNSHWRRQCCRVRPMSRRPGAPGHCPDPP